MSNGENLEWERQGTTERERGQQTILFYFLKSNNFSIIKHFVLSQSAKV